MNEEQMKVIAELYAENDRLERENNQLKEQLHKCSIDIQELYEQDINCPSSCHRFKELRSWLKKILDDENDIFSVIRVKDVLSKLNELEGGKND